ncbi:putative aldo-keto reductase [Tricharina praecox]|uniref:putative aldo-keto reductase n=1 Tax=Tricharina praecox TaxID=43433 RepID=UPI00221E9E37|nr:putative aldo-keto reductase [Tricharina praecox]KAI5848817.1 putative aldo-keto reductase [Tricharina praecox]
MTSLPKRTLGRDGPEVTAFGLGCMGLSAFYGPIKPDEERFAFLDRAHELGLTFWDSADMYMDNEELIGKWFTRTGKRSDIFLASKFGINRFQEGRFLRGDREYVKAACDRSLKKLQTDCIDLYYAHRADPEIPIEETVNAMLELKAEGKIKYLGLSECSAETLRRACAVAPIAAYQIEYSPFFTDIERPDIGVLEAARELGVTIIAYSPLGRGLLTGKYRSADDFPEGDFRRDVPRYNAENFPKNFKIVEDIEKIAKKKGCTPGQLTLAWVSAQGKDFIPIFGTTRIENLEENLGGLKVVLTPEENAEIRKAVDSLETFGARYPEQMLGALFGSSAPKK